MIKLIYCFNLLTLGYSFAYAQVIQVPEACVNKKSPCLVRTENSFFEFEHRDIKFKMNPETIIKLTYDENNDHLEILEGHVILNSNKSGSSKFVHHQPCDNGMFMLSRENNKLKSLRLDNFKFELYELKNDAVEIVKSDFIDKLELISFSKEFFIDINKYKAFLSSIEKRWKEEFIKDNSSQTKVLLRSIASEQERVKKEADEKRKNERSLKKVRDNFFYRTFYR